MKKSDLKSGMIVETVSEGFYLVVTGCQYECEYIGDTVLVGVDGYNTLKEYHENLCLQDRSMPEFNIIAVYHPKTAHNVFKLLKKGCPDKTLIWKRPEPVKVVTMHEIENKFGCKIKIVG